MVNEIQSIQMYPSSYNKEKYQYKEIHSQQIQQNKSAKYLGVVIDEHLTWKEHVNNICSKAIKAKAFLQQNLHHCPASMKSNCYTSLVRPIQ